MKWTDKDEASWSHRDHNVAVYMRGEDRVGYVYIYFTHE
jgi:hypothetical protein